MSPFIVKHCTLFHGIFFSKKKCQKFSVKENKNFRYFREITFFWLSWFRSQFGVCLGKFRGSRPAGLGGDRECTNSSKRLSQIIIYSPNATLRRAPRFHGKICKQKSAKIFFTKKKFSEFFREFFFQFFCLSVLRR
jgi:hypothetical protein